MEADDHVFVLNSGNYLRHVVSEIEALVPKALKMVSLTWALTAAVEIQNSLT